MDGKSLRRKGVVRDFGLPASGFGLRASGLRGFGPSAFREVAPPATGAQLARGDAQHARPRDLALLEGLQGLVGLLQIEESDFGLERDFRR